MPDPDGVIENASLADGVITDRLLDDNVTTSSFTATSTFTGPYETTVAAADTQRISLNSGVLRGFTGDGDETAPGVIEATVNGSGATRTLQTVVWAPSFIADDGGVYANSGGASLAIRSASFDDSTTPPGVVISYNGVSTQIPEIRATGNLRLIVESWEWQAWSPTYNDFTLGNGTVTARYAQLNDTVIARFSLVFGSTTTIDALNPRFSMPVVAAANYVFTDRLGVADLEDDGTNQIEATTRVWDVNEFVITTVNTAGTYGVHTGISATVPFTWATGDTISFQATYEAA